MRNEIIEIDTLLNSKERFLSEYSSDSPNSMYFFNDWQCQDVSLRKRAKDLVNKIDFLVNETLISNEDYVYFENEIKNGFDTNFIFIVRLNGNKRTDIGGFSFSNSRHKGSGANVWSGARTPSEERVLKSQCFESWFKLKRLLTKDFRLRALVRKDFMHHS